MPDQLMEQPEKRAADLHYQRARRSWRARFAADYRHWVRRTFSRESYVSSLKALLWVAPLSALIWSYAFNEQLLITNPINVKFAVSDDTDRVIRLAPGEDRKVQVKLKGPQKDVATVEDYLNTNAVRLDVDRNLGPGRHTINVAAALNHDPEIKSHGMTVDSYQPAEIAVDVDTLDYRTVEVRLPPDMPVGVQATFTPTKVKLSGPKQDLAAADPQFVYAVIKRDSSFLNTPGTVKLPAVALEPQKGLDESHLQLTPSTVSAEIQVTGAEDSWQVPAISVLMAVPTGTQIYENKVSYEARMTNVKIAGPKAAIDSIRSGRGDTPYAEFVVDFSNPGTQRIATLQFPKLPAGVRVVTDNNKPLTIQYTVEERKAADH